MESLISAEAHRFQRSQAFPDGKVDTMPEGILVRPRPDYNKIAYQLKPRIHLTMDGENLFLSSDSVNWVLKIDRRLAVELAGKIIELGAGK